MHATNEKRSAFFQLGAPLFQFPISCTEERRMILATTASLQYVDIFTDEQQKVSHSLLRARDGVRTPRRFTSCQIRAASNMKDKEVWRK